MFLKVNLDDLNTCRLSKRGLYLSDIVKLGEHDDFAAWSFDIFV